MTIEQRLQKLERSNTRLKRMLVGVFGLLIIGGLTGAAQWNKIVTAERFVLVDSSGNSRAELGLDATGNPNLTMFYKNQKLATKIGLEDDKSAQVWLLGPSSYSVAKLSTSRTGSFLNIGNMGSRATLQTQELSPPKLHLLGKDVGSAYLQNVSGEWYFEARGANQKLSRFTLGYPNRTGHLGVWEEGGYTYVGVRKAGGGVEILHAVKVAQ
jgi:hypothetical protein